MITKIIYIIVILGVLLHILFTFTFITNPISQKDKNNRLRSCRSGRAFIFCIMLNLYIHKQSMNIFGNSVGARKAKFIRVGFWYQRSFFSCLLHVKIQKGKKSPITIIKRYYPNTPPLPVNTALTQQLYAPVNAMVRPNAAIAGYCNTIMRNRSLGLSNYDIYRKRMLLQPNIVNNFGLLRRPLQHENRKILSMWPIESLSKTEANTAILKRCSEKNLNLLKILQDKIEAKDHMDINFLNDCIKYITAIQKDDITADFKSLIESLNKYFAELKKTNNQEIIETNKERVQSFLSKPTLQRDFTAEDYQNKINYCLEGIELLTNITDLTDKEYIAIIKKSGVISYPDVFYSGFYEYNNLMLREHMNIKEMEGLKLTSKGSSLLQQYQDSLKTLKNNVMPTANQIDKIIVGLKNREYSVGLLRRSPKDAELLYGIDLHIVIIIRDPENVKYGFIMGMFTSAKDDGTIKLSMRQEINKENKNKEQHLRIPKRFIRINLEQEFEEVLEMTAYMHKFSEGDISVHDIAITNIINNLEKIKTQPIEDPMTLTLEVLTKLALISYEQQITNCNEVLNTYNKLSMERRVIRERQMQNQKKNFINDMQKQQYKDSLSTSDKLLYKIKTTLEKHIANINKNKQKQVANEPQVETKSESLES